jgi:hypothetical protein
VSNSRRLRRVPIRYECLAHLMCEGKKFRVLHGLPRDAEILRLVACDKTGIFYAFVSSSEYPEVKSGDVVPEADLPVIEDLNGIAGR